MSQKKLKIEILGPGCQKCQKLEHNVKKAIEELQVDAEISKITDVTTITEKGIMFTPALIINDKTVASGKVASVEEIKKSL